MDSTQTSTVVGAAPMRTAGPGSRQLLLPGEAGVGGESVLSCACWTKSIRDHPFYGVRKMTVWLHLQGHAVGPKRVRRLLRAMGLMAVYPKPRLSLNPLAHKRFPYLLKGVAIVRPNQVWSTDITYIRLRGGFVFSGRGHRLVQPLRAGLGAVDHAWKPTSVWRSWSEPWRIQRPEIFNTDQGRAIHQRAVPSAAAGGPGALEHGRARPGLRQHLRTAPAVAKVVCAPKECPANPMCFKSRRPCHGEFVALSRVNSSIAKLTSFTRSSALRGCAAARRIALIRVPRLASFHTASSLPRCCKCTDT